jgi:hypothetical protein
VFHTIIYRSVGEENIKDALKNYAKHESLYREFSAYYYLTQDDPPIYLGYGLNLTVPATSIGYGIHHGMFGQKFKERSEDVGHSQVYLNGWGDDEVIQMLLGN